MLGGELDPRHPLRLWTGPRGLPRITADSPEHEMDATLTPFTVGTAGDRRRDFDPILGRELDWLWPRSNESRTPASVRTNQRLGLKVSSKAPVVTMQEVEVEGLPGYEVC